MFCTFWLENVLRATTACTFSTSQLPKAVRSWGVLYILTWKCASCHNVVQFFISHLASWLRTRRFSEPTFRPSGATNHWKNRVFRDFPAFSRTWIFFLLKLSLSSSRLFPDSSHLCFSSVHIVGSLTSKLPSINNLSFMAFWNPAPRRIDSAVCTATKVWSLGGSCEGSTRPAFSKLVWAITSQDGSLVVPCHV